MAFLESAEDKTDCEPVYLGPTVGYQMVLRGVPECTADEQHPAGCCEVSAREVRRFCSGRCAMEGDAGCVAILEECMAFIEDWAQSVAAEPPAGAPGCEAVFLGIFVYLLELVLAVDYMGKLDGTGWTDWTDPMDETDMAKTDGTLSK